MSILEKFDSCIEEKTGKSIGVKHDSFFKLSIVELKAIFDEDVLDKLIKGKQPYEYLHFITDEKNKIYYTKLTSKDFLNFHFRGIQKSDGAYSFYHIADDVFFEQVNEMYTERVNESNVLKSVLEHPKYRLKALYM